MIDVAGTLNSGQAFLWEEHEGTWYGVDGQDVLAVDGSGRARALSGRGRDLFRRRDDMGRVLGSISRDAAVRRAVRRYPGLRILDQDPFQCLVSFIVSSNSSIQKIRSCLRRIAGRFGEEAELDGRAFRLFPDAGRLAGATAAQIRGCGAGYRARYVRDAARMVRDGRVDLPGLRGAGYAEAREAVMSVPGVGAKVADCVMLFSLDKLDAFPLDRWVLRALGRCRGRFAARAGALTPRRYEELHDEAVGYFGPYAGYAQQFLFKAERDGAGRGWA